MTAADRLDDIQTRYVEWHQDRGDHTPAPDDWLDADPGESMEHCIVRNDVPVMHAALRAVLDLHRPLRLYEHEDVCGRTDEEHCDERHVEFEEGCEYYCLDHPTDYVMCAECRDVNGDSVDYPCPTVRAIEVALGEVAS